jgi:hypothetical protein
MQLVGDLSDVSALTDRVKKLGPVLDLVSAAQKLVADTDNSDFVQDADPGAVGAGKTWCRKLSGGATWSIRNSTNSAWTFVFATGSIGGDAQTLPAGTNWTGFMDAYNKAAPGDTIRLANETLRQEAQLQITKPIKILGSGPLSKIVWDANVFNTSNPIWVGFGDNNSVVDGTVLADFEIEHIRTNPASRGLAISVFNGSRNTTIRNIKFTNITSDCVIVRNEGALQPASNPNWKILDGVNVIGCTANEWYESFFNIHEGSCSNIVVANNNCYTSRAHPDSSVSRPYATIINIEERKYPGLVENVTIANNTFTSDLGKFNASDWIDSIGLSIRQNDDPDLRYTRIYVTGNTYSNWNHNCQVVTINGQPSQLFPGPAFIYILKNTFQWGGNSPTVRIAPYGNAGDKIVLGDNDIWYLKDKPLNVPIFYDNQYDPSGLVQFVQDPPNRLHAV